MIPRRDGGQEADTRDGQRRREAVEDFVWSEVLGGGDDGETFSNGFTSDLYQHFHHGRQTRP